MTYEEAVEEIKKENDELIRTQWVGILALVISFLTFVITVIRKG